ncbi:MAG: hypothetical protein EOO65_03445 [Methanosarcinales archaeon]|nr:MAG: hypothetical protein EOO65_03445 [Methanosarcinales archaeon]
MGRVHTCAMHMQVARGAPRASAAYAWCRRVALMEDEEGNVHLKNLSMHPASSEEEALNLLFLGDTNRAIAETPMNMASSRSHCIFTISVESRQEGSSTVRRSKLHLVDLAGSERVHKTQASGQLFREATHINKSLHFLEMVIVALQEQRKGTRTHIPYRNSMMTSVLRDSLGGNCKTTMIATINPEPEHTEESISTCRFAQRVARVQNSAIVNEETDPVILIRQVRACCWWSGMIWPARVHACNGAIISFVVSVWTRRVGCSSNPRSLEWRLR